MPDDPNRPSEPQRDINGNPIPPPSFAPPPARPLPGAPPPSFGGPPPGGAQQYGQTEPPEQKYDLAGNPLPSPAAPPPSQTPYGMPGGTPGAWPPPPGGQVAPNPYGRPGVYPVQVNGSQIMIMGILSIVCLGFVLGPIAYVQGTNALAAIDRGEADPSQRGNVATGRICGLIGGILNVSWIILNIVLAVSGHALFGHH